MIEKRCFGINITFRLIPFLLVDDTQTQVMKMSGPFEKQDLENIDSQTYYRRHGFGSEPQSCYSYPNISINSTFSSSANYGNSYNNYPLQQSSMSHQNYCLFNNLCTVQTDMPSWESNKLSPDIEKVSKISEKTDTIDTTSKDLSSASYCSNNVNTLVSESNYYSMFDNQWMYPSNTNGCTNYSLKNVPYSCGETKILGQINTPTKFDSIQKSSNVIGDSEIKNTGNIKLYENNYGNIRKSTAEQYNPYSYCNYYENKQPQDLHQVSMNENSFYVEGISSVALDQQTEASNDESDIIIEESDEEQTDLSEDQESNLYQENKCLVCNIVYTPLGLQFYFLTLQNPLTMSSQIPVLQKLFDVVGTEITPMNYLCSKCLGLINTIDHLQCKLDSFIRDITAKFQNTCAQNNMQYITRQNVEANSEKADKKPSFNKVLKFKCPICKKIMCLKKYYQYHLAKHKLRGYLCELCGKICKTRKMFLFHSKMHTYNVCKITAFKCTNCDKIFRTKSNLKEHHNFCVGSLPFSCKNQYCNKKFASFNKLKNHTRLKHDKKFIAICSICNIGFVKVSDYKSHMVSHSTDKKYLCKKCDKSYKTLSNLNFHMKMHNKVLPFVCNICQKGFMRKEYLESHVNNHKGIKKFVCTICLKEFVSQKNLDAHLKYHEGSDKKNTCNICGKTMKSGIEEHLRIHSNLAEFECDLCDLKFNTKGTLYKHKKRKHIESIKS